MPLSALALVLLAALLHAGWNVVAKRHGGGPHFALACGLWIAIAWAPLGLWLAWREAPHWGWKVWALLAASGAVHVAYFQTLLTGYRRADLTVVYPVARGTGPLLSSMLAVLLLDEHLGALGLVGVLGITGGVFLLAGGPALLRPAPARHSPPAGAQPSAGAATSAGAGRSSEADRRAAAEAHARRLAGVRWGAATGVLIAGYTLIDGYAVKVALISPILVDYLGNLLRLPWLLPRAWADRAGFCAEWRGNWRAALGVALVSPVGYVMVLFAVQLAPLSHVAPAREVSMLFAALIGGRLLGEGDRLARLAGAGCIAAGVMLLVAG